MQAVKDKIHDLSTMRKAKAEARAEEKAEKELAKARTGIAHEVRLAREAEASMEFHVAKAEKLAQKEITKHAQYDGADGRGPTQYTHSGHYGGHDGDPNINPATANPTTMGTEPIDPTGILPTQEAGAPRPPV